MLTIAEIRANQPVEFRNAMDAIVARSDSAKRAGGQWRLYLPMPGSRRLNLHWSYATEAEASAALAPMYPAVRARAEIRYEK